MASSKEKHATSLRNKLQIVSFQNNFILNILRHVAVDARAHVDASDEELAQKVADFNQGALVDLLGSERIFGGERNLDGEVSVPVPNISVNPDDNVEDKKKSAYANLILYR